MWRRTFLLRFAGVLTLQVARSTRLGFASVSDSNDNELCLVKTICFGKVEGLRRDDHFLAELRSELAKRSLSVTTDVENPDAVLTGVIETVVVLDGDGTNLLDDTLRFQLTSPSSNVQIWRAQIGCVANQLLIRTTSTRRNG